LCHPAERVATDNGGDRNYRGAYLNIARMRKS
jgi:hypothetical protein